MHHLFRDEALAPPRGSRRQKQTVLQVSQPPRQRLVCLDIPDLYGYMDPALVELLEAKVPRYLGLAK